VTRTSWILFLSNLFLFFALLLLLELFPLPPVS
jgi:hypothetical protein